VRPAAAAPSLCVFLPAVRWLSSLAVAHARAVHYTYIAVAIDPVKLQRMFTCIASSVVPAQYKFLTVSITKRLRNGRFTSGTAGGCRSETATWIQEWLKKSLELELLESSRHGMIDNSFSRRRRWAWL
jgi:hypothetical protein